MSNEETVGILNGLAHVIKEQVAANKARGDEIASLAAAVKDLKDFVGNSISSSGLRLPNLTLPEFTGNEDLDRFVEQFTNILQASGTDFRHHFTYLKQQCRKDARAFDFLCTWEQEHFQKLPHTPSKADFEKYFRNAIRALQAHRGIPQDQQIRNLLATYYTMQQHPQESVSHSAHRFLETQHSLERLIPGIHKTNAGEEIELIHAFAIKLRADISKDILARDFNYPTLTALIEAAKRYETRADSNSTAFDVAQPSPQAMPTNVHQRVPRPFAAKHDKNSVTGELCRQYNKFHRAYCETSSGLCKKGYLHKCSHCHNFNCKAVNHSKNRKSSFNSSARPSSRSKVDAHVASSKDPLSDSALLKSIHSLLLSKETVASKPADTTPPSLPGGSQDPLYSTPAVSLPPKGIKISNLNLANRNILWCPVFSAGVSLPLPLDTCCSVSLVSQQHADHILKSRPDLQFSRIEQQVNVSVASPSVSLKAVGVMQVPILFENGRSATFSMLVVPGLSWPILFGQNHLRMTNAHIRSRELKVYFADKQLGFEVACKDVNPAKSFPALCSSHSGFTSSANVTCLLTAVPPPPQTRAPISLHKGFNLVTVCLMLATSLASSPYFSTLGDLWLEGKQVLPGVNTISGPIHFSGLSRMTQLTDHATPYPPVPSHPKCRPSVPIPTVGPKATGLLAEISDNINSLAAIPQTQDYCYTHVVIHSTRESTTLPFNAFIGTIRPMDDADRTVLQSAAEFTASQVANQFFVPSQVTSNFVSDEVSAHVSTTDSANCTRATSHSNADKPYVQSSELDSSILAPYLESTALDSDETFPYTSTADKSLHPFSSEFFQKLLDALGLDAPSYAHVPSNVLCQFTSLLYRYQHVFHLPDSPFLLVFGRHAPSPETIALNMPSIRTSADQYAHNLVSRMKQAHAQFRDIKADLRRRQRELYDIASRDLPEGKIVYMCKESAPSKSRQKTRFLRTFDGPFKVIGHPHDKQNLLYLRHLHSGIDLPRPINVEKIVVIPDQDPSGISPDATIQEDISAPAEQRMLPLPYNPANPDLAEVGYKLGKYLETLPSKSVVSSQACKFIYESYPPSRAILARHGRLRGLIKACPFLQLQGAPHGGIYILSLNTDLFTRLHS